MSPETVSLIFLHSTAPVLSLYALRAFAWLAPSFQARLQLNKTTKDTATTHNEGIISHLEGWLEAHDCVNFAELSEG